MLRRFLGDPFIEASLVNNKFQFEVVKKKLDMHFSFANITPQFYKSPHLPEMKEIMDDM